MVQDHINSTAMTLNNSGAVTGEVIYSAWGEVRNSYGSTPTKKLYTGQYEAEAGLYFYNARWYDIQLGRFVQGDSIIPEPVSPQSWDRYAYVNNNPIRFNDPSGHNVDCGIGESGCRQRIKVEKAEGLLSQIIKNNNYSNWDNLTKKEQKTLLDIGWDSDTFNMSDYAISSLTDISGTYQDPVIYISLFLGNGLSGPTVSGSKFLINQAAFTCFRNPWCGRTVFGLPTLYSSHVNQQSDTFHNFPRLFDQIIIRNGERIIKNINYVEYQIEGEIALAKGTAGYKLYSGIFQIGVELRNYIPTITHHFFEH